MMRPLRFCLVSSNHVANNPRLVKEADALAAAGHAVRVVAANNHEALSRRDAGTGKPGRRGCAHGRSRAVADGHGNDVTEAMEDR